MFPHQKNQVTTLEEDFKSLGLDPEKSLGTIERQHALVEQRIGVPGKPAVGGDPPIVGIPDPSEPGRPATLHEDAPGGAPKPAPATAKVQISEDATDEIRKAYEMMEAVGEYEPLVDLTDIDAANQEEAFRAVRKKIRSAADKLSARLKRRRGRAQARVASRKYRKKNKRKIMVRMMKKLKKFGRAGLAKLHKMGKRVMMKEDKNDLFGGALQELREDLNSGVSGGGSDADYSGPFEEAAFNAGWLSMLLGEHMEALGDEQSAETLYALSDRCADLAEELDGVLEDDLTEDQEEQLRECIDSCVKGIRVYEGLGAPSLGECIEFAEGRLQG